MKKIGIRITALLLVLLCLSLLLTGCGTKAGKSNRYKIVCTVFPLYDWVCHITADCEDMEVILLVKNGTDLHSYQPTAADMVQLASADLVIGVGGESDTWVTEALKSNGRTDKALFLSTVDSISLYTAEVECVESDHDHDHDEKGMFDEHIWLSVRNAAGCCSAIADYLCKERSEAAEAIRTATASYLQQLSALDAAFSEAVQAGERKSLVFADRFPFVYLTEDYGLSYCAAFAGCSTESAANFETVTRLAQRVDEWSLPCLLISETSDGALARSVVGATTAKNAVILTMDSMQSVTDQQIAEGRSYCGVMEENLAVLRQALGAKQG